MLTDLLRIYEYPELLIALAAFVIHSVTAFRTIRSFENGALDAVSSIGPQPPNLTVACHLHTFICFIHLSEGGAMMYTAWMS